MNGAQHTPGPWSYRLNRPGTAWLIEAGEKLIAAPSWNEYGSPRFPTKAESEANARLIVAAPLMLGTLENLQTTLASVGAANEEIDAAIAVAKGGRQ